MICWLLEFSLVLVLKKISKKWISDGSVDKYFEVNGLRTKKELLTIETAITTVEWITVKHVGIIVWIVVWIAKVSPASIAQCVTRWYQKEHYHKQSNQKQKQLKWKKLFSVSKFSKLKTNDLPDFSGNAFFALFV